MSTKTTLLNNLFEKWENNIPQYQGKFVKDGINNEELFEAAPTKVLFIAKEPNNSSQTPGDFREWWKEDLIYSFSLRIAEWSYGILNDFPQYDEIISNPNCRLIAMQQIAFMNIKKIGGLGNSEYNGILEHLQNNFSYIHEEIEIISPDLIITGTSYDRLRNALFPDVTWVKSGYNLCIGRFKNSKIIDFYHPSSRNAPAASYSLLQTVCFKILLRAVNLRNCKAIK